LPSPYRLCLSWLHVVSVKELDHFLSNWNLHFYSLCTSSKKYGLRKLEKATRRKYSENGDAEMTEEIEIEIQDDGILVIDQDSAGKTDWDELTRVVRNEDHALIFIGYKPGACYSKIIGGFWRSRIIS